MNLRIKINWYKQNFRLRYKSHEFNCDSSAQDVFDFEY